jgi:hypothetical protein
VPVPDKVRERAQERVHLQVVSTRLLPGLAAAQVPGQLEEESEEHDDDDDDDERRR